MLYCKYFRRSHHTGLVSVVHRDEGREHGHHRLAAAHVSLQEAVHLLSGHGIAAYLLDDPFLSSRQLIGQVAVAPVECLSDFPEKYAGRAAHPYVLLPQQGQLQEEQLLEFQTVPGRFQASYILGKMYIAQGKCQGRQLVGRNDLLGQGLPDESMDLLLESLLQLGEYLDGDAVVAQLVGAGIDAYEC